MVAWLVALLISIAISILTYVITPKPKASKPEAAKEMDGPTAEAGREIPVLFGEMTMKSPNCLWWGERSMLTYDVKG